MFQIQPTHRRASGEALSSLHRADASSIFQIPNFALMPPILRLTVVGVLTKPQALARRMRAAPGKPANIFGPKRADPTRKAGIHSRF